MSDRFRTAVGIGFVTLAEEHIFTFMLSSPFTARNIVKEKNDQAEVMKDLWIAVGLSIAFSVMMGLLLGDVYTTVFGGILAILMFWIYEIRGKL